MQYDPQTQVRPNIIVYAEGLFYASVCVPKDMPKDNILSGMFPSGTTAGWQFSKDKTFSTGQANPCQCDYYPDRIHYLLEC